MENRTGRKSIKRNNSGTTLAELVVSFALLGLFLVCASMMAASIAKMYYRVRAINYGMRVSQILQSKIAGELEGAVKAELSRGSLTGCMFLDGESVEFMDCDGNHVKLGMIEDEENGKYYLNFHYYENLSGTEGRENRKESAKSGDWHYDKAVYLGYSVKKLKFTRLRGQEAGNVIKTELTLTSSLYGDYSTTGYVELIHFEDEEADGKIIVTE